MCPIVYLKLSKALFFKGIQESELWLLLKKLGSGFSILGNKLQPFFTIEIFIENLCEEK